MTFRLIEGRSAFGLTRWIQASGQVQPDTGARFEAFARTTRTAGLTIALDSPGGSMMGGMALGRALRAAGVNATIGRTVVRREGGREVHILMTHMVRCNSACAYAFLGGVNRRIASTSTLGVHQFTNPAFTSQRNSQETMRFVQQSAAQVVVYLQEIGADQRIFAVASSQPTGIRNISAREHQELGTAFVVSGIEAQGVPVGWSSSLNQGLQPMLYRRETRFADGPVRIDLEVLAGCRDAQNYTVLVRFILARAPEHQEIALETARLDLDSVPVHWRRPDGQTLRARGQSNSLWFSVAVPREAFHQAARSGRLTVSIPNGAGIAGDAEIGDGLAEAVPAFAAGCDAAEQRRLAAPRPK